MSSCARPQPCAKKISSTTQSGMISFIVLAVILSVAEATLYPAQLSSRSSLYHTQQSSRVLGLSSACASQIKACPLTSSVCAATICKVCTALGISPPLEPCCHAPTPTNCFANNYINGVTSSAASIPPASLEPTIGAGSLACKSLFSIYDACEAATPG